MDKELQIKALKALERQEKQYKRQNKYISDTYDRISVTLPKGYKDIITDAGFTINGYINQLVKSDLENRGLID